MLYSTAEGGGLRKDFFSDNSIFYILHLFDQRPDVIVWYKYR
ncbi:hypothetical protein DYBT9275_02571 [Dyadobacter sp. CECT 9275]|uniref:Uncharacterized protein n=1 Tax=Dyadobacter helix TaxID=2822344 RepID=A0A916JDA6_9BACT|nr:hypothetical protein [Dyadobacter sp. CECT 9275]CAG5000983.1 hypothetical protein DYBT9275_02571 [Dyadobacter sp. CECT 9275]